MNLSRRIPSDIYNRLCAPSLSYIPTLAVAHVEPRSIRTLGSVDGQDYALELPMHLWGRELKRIDPVLLREFEDPERGLTCEVLDLVPAWFEFPVHEGGHQVVGRGGGNGVGRRLIRSSGYLL